MNQVIRSRAGAVVAGAAVLAVLSGGGAVASGMIGSADIRDGSVSKRDIGVGAVGSVEVKDGTLGLRDFNDHTKNVIRKHAQSGAPGTQGEPGPVGAAGADGKNGLDGENGLDGTDGLDGTNGTNGTDGADGKNGTPGVSGLVTQFSYGWSRPGSYDHVTAECPEGKFAIGGGYQLHEMRMMFEGTSLNVFEDRAVQTDASGMPRAWRVSVYNAGSYEVDFEVEVICANAS